ncbi:SycD/LcrH family type III secretion system chaperone [Microbulbifer sp. JMSA003]|uniref:SycD/LcrH family type III secretion system chaperone n=1 Tax=unclassified Microbulbifer TaxID=2619833 RepID=UPI0040397E65
MSKVDSVPSLTDDIDENDWINFLEKGGTLAEALDVNAEELEAIYTLAYKKYESCNYKEALSLFQLLCQCDHYEAKYMLGLGATRQALSEHQLAGETFSFAAIVHPHDPRFPYYAAECHLALGDWRSAGSGFEMTMLRCEGKPEFQTLNEKATAQFERLKAKLDREQQIKDKSNDDG